MFIERKLTFCRTLKYFLMGLCRRTTWNTHLISSVQYITWVEIRGFLYGLIAIWIDFSWWWIFFPRKSGISRKRIWINRNNDTLCSNTLLKSFNTQTIPKSQNLDKNSIESYRITLNGLIWIWIEARRFCKIGSTPKHCHSKNRNHF